MKVSICIPTWEQFGRGIEFLKNNLDKISKQTYKNFEVVVSDHSKDSEIEILCSEYKNHFEINYFKNQEKLGNGPANTNNAIKNSKGDIVKIIFQDDFFYDETALETIIKKFENGAKWVVNGCNHTHDDGKTFSNFMVPYWNSNIATGTNTISSPSVLSFINNDPCLFDEDLVMLMDCEMYYQLYKRYGLPIVIPNILITNRMHPHQISSMYNKNMWDEINHVKTKHKLI
jgi:glycosyltransferase involved in cell wall biosynthesis